MVAKLALETNSSGPKVPSTRNLKPFYIHGKKTLDLLPERVAGQV